MNGAGTGRRPSRWRIPGPLAGLAGLPLLAGCALVGRPAVPLAPPPMETPPAALAVAPVTTFPFSERVEPAVLTPPPAEEAAPLPDPILGAAWTGDPRMVREVDRWTDWWAGSRYFPRYLRRMGRYEEMVERALEERALPASLRFLPIVESGYSPVAVSRVGATGLWQFMSPTARLVGLEVNAVVDERRDPFRATDGALEYLATLHGRFGSWPLALAAYNGGPARVARLLRRHAPGGGDPDSLFQVIRPYLPRETRDFVPRFLAAARVAGEPGRYGLADVPLDPPATFDEVEVPDATTLDVVARSAGVPLARIEALNPHLVRGLTPAGVATRLRVPAGLAPTFREAYARIPPGERVTFLVHRVASGETLGHIARRYGVRVSDLRAANPRVDPRRMQIGQPLVVVRAPSTAEGRWTEMVGRAASGEGPGAPGRRAGDGDGRREASGDGGQGEAGAVERGGRGPVSRVHEVGAGETLWEIARLHWITVEELRAWNGLDAGAVLHPGDRLEIRAVGLVVHTVEPGETLAGLARRHGIDVGELARWNDLTPAARLEPGSEILVPGGS